MIPSICLPQTRAATDGHGLHIAPAQFPDAVQTVNSGTCNTAATCQKRIDGATNKTFGHVMDTCVNGTDPTSYDLGAYPVGAVWSLFRRFLRRRGLQSGIQGTYSLAASFTGTGCKGPVSTAMAVRANECFLLPTINGTLYLFVCLFLILG